jgi:glycosyltransferase involved in cell wall biosynthesis
VHSTLELTTDEAKLSIPLQLLSVATLAIRRSARMKTIPMSDETDCQRKKKILFVEPLIMDTTVDTLHKDYLLNILRQLVETGHKSSLIVMRSRTNVHQNPHFHTISIPLRYVPIVSALLFGIALSVFLPLYIITAMPDFVIVKPDFAVLGVIPGIIASKFRKSKFVLDIRSTPVETVGLRGFLQKFWFSAAVLIAKKWFDGITIITPLMRKEVCNTFHIDQNKVGIWTAGVSPTVYCPETHFSNSKRLKEKLGFSGKFIVFYHGAFRPTGGLAETVEAVQILKEKHLDIALFLLGAGPVTPLLKNLIHKENLTEHVFIHDPVGHLEVPKFIGMSDVCIVPLPDHPYWRHQCPLKLLEYLAMEKVTIVTDIPAHRSIIDEQECGIYIPSIEPNEIARAIEHAYQNRHRLQRWGKSGRTIINEKYTWEKVVQDLENYLSSIDHRTTA